MKRHAADQNSKDGGKNFTRGQTSKDFIMRRINFFYTLMQMLGLSVACQANAAIERQILLAAELPPVIEVTGHNGALQKEYQLEFEKNDFLRLAIPIAVSWNMKNTQISIKLNSKAELINKNDNKEKIEMKVSVNGEPLSETSGVLLSGDPIGAMPSLALDMRFQSPHRGEFYRAGVYAGIVSIKFSTGSSSL